MQEPAPIGRLPSSAGASPNDATAPHRPSSFTSCDVLILTTTSQQYHGNSPVRVVYTSSRCLGKVDGDSVRFIGTDCAQAVGHTPPPSFPHPVYVIPAPVYVIPAKAGIYCAQAAADWTHPSELPSPSRHADKSTETVSSVLHDAAKEVGEPSRVCAVEGWVFQGAGVLFEVTYIRRTG